jgi:hypothetical protein
VLAQFVLKENVGKLGGKGYFGGLFSGPYPVWRIWLGHFLNSGLLALPLLYVVIVSIKHRARLRREEKALWILVLSFLIVYTIPSQRQANYLIPTSPALAVLLGVRWSEIKGHWFYVFHIPILVALLLLATLTQAISNALPQDSYQPWQLVIPIAAILLSAFGLILNRAGPYVFHFLVFLTFISFAFMVAPLEGPLGRYPPRTVTALRGKVVYVPAHFISRQERHRFLLPGTRIRGYFTLNKGHMNRLLESRRFVAINRALGQPVAGPFRVFGTRLDMKTRQTPAELVRILLHHDLDLLIHQEIIVRRRRTK